jgi:hypothetical protein
MMNLRAEVNLWEVEATKGVPYQWQKNDLGFGERIIGNQPFGPILVCIRW